MGGGWGGGSALEDGTEGDDFTLEEFAFDAGVGVEDGSGGFGGFGVDDDDAEEAGGGEGLAGEGEGALREEVLEVGGVLVDEGRFLRGHGLQGEAFAHGFNAEQELTGGPGLGQGSGGCQ